MNQILESFLKNNNADLNIFGKFIVIALIFLVINIINKIVKKLIDRTLFDKGAEQITNNKRANTLGQVLKRISFYLLVFIGVMISLDLFNVPTTSILATAGIGGLAIGFGAQSLVKDIITGFFILLENQYSVGDLIATEGYEGIVEELGLRVTKLRGFSGDLNIIPNSRIGIVANKSRGGMRALIEVTIAYEEDIDRAIDVIQEVCSRLKENNKKIIEGPAVLGVSSLGIHGYNLMIVAKAQPMEQWSVERELRKNVKEALEDAGIEIPYSKLVIVKKPV